MDTILQTIDELERLGFPPRDILAAVRSRAQEELDERDRWADRQSEAAERAEYERTHGEPIAF